MFINFGFSISQVYLMVLCWLKDKRSYVLTLYQSPDSKYNLVIYFCDSLHIFIWKKFLLLKPITINQSTKILFFSHRSANLADSEFFNTMWFSYRYFQNYFIYLYVTSILYVLKRRINRGVLTPDYRCDCCSYECNKVQIQSLSLHVGSRIRIVPSPVRCKGVWFPSQSTEIDLMIVYPCNLLNVVSDRL